ncbi:Gp49 family protein [Saccharicrinis sp. GN24d3]|uniref:Gp49 family protein n=1 Tax=Saccharicrinis sp. GN24d3 TaxID=3458416 RepID=UPI0040373DD0
MDKNTIAITEEVLNEAIELVEFKRMGKKMVICLITTKNGHEIIGQAGIVDHRKFDVSLGEKFSLVDAKNNLANLLAYQAQSNLQTILKEIEK